MTIVVRLYFAYDAFYMHVNLISEVDMFVGGGGRGLHVAACKIMQVVGNNCTLSLETHIPHYEHLHV